ncbi:polymorphic toxin-type HINT domain-containing protein [Streptomyces sp. NPDC005303]|uniref:polymorphic toxin-type HINT domain-containing protein n=1 Tax=Streptomyces sp. NPDC005303 TaxID=3155713 RepID=UPI0033BF7B48
MLLADGSTKAIDQVRVGDTIANSVPGVAGTQAHKVTAVIVTHTDHDFVDLTIKATADSTAKQSVKTGAKSLAKKVARKAAFGLAASAAVLGALAASHGHGTAQEPATKTVAAVSSATMSDQSTKAAGTSSDAQGAHLTTTFHHPFYDETQSAFVDAKNLKPGDVLQTPTGTAEITGVRLYHANTTTYDLTIGTLHTYYVEAGTTPVLVHNCDVSLTEEEAATLEVGPHATRSVRSSDPSKVTNKESAAMQDIAVCHTCGESDPSLTYVGDHQPSTALASPGGEQDLYPHCPACSLEQSTAVQKALQILRNHGYHDPKWPGDARYPDILPAREMLLKLLPGHTG